MLPLRLDLRGDLVERQFIEPLIAIFGVIAGAGMELAKKPHGIHDAHFPKQDTRGLLVYLDEGANLCGHGPISVSSSSGDTIFVASPFK
jgi:hypothetical protein